MGRLEFEQRRRIAGREVSVILRGLREDVKARKDSNARKHFGVEETMFVTETLDANENERWVHK